MEIEYGVQVYAGDIDAALTDDDDFRIPLLPALERTLSRHDRAILLSEHKWFCVGRSGSRYFFYNSHSVDILNKSRGDGVSRVFFCNNLQEIVLLFSHGLKSKIYESLYGVEVRIPQ